MRLLEDCSVFQRTQPSVVSTMNNKGLVSTGGYPISAVRRFSGMRPGLRTRSSSRDLLNDSARVASRYLVSRNISHDHTPGANYAVIANRHARTDDAMSP